MARLKLFQRTRSPCCSFDPRPSHLPSTTDNNSSKNYYPPHLSSLSLAIIPKIRALGRHFSFSLSLSDRDFKSHLLSQNSTLIHLVGIHVRVGIRDGGWKCRIVYWARAVTFSVLDTLLGTEIIFGMVSQ